MNDLIYVTAVELTPINTSRKSFYRKAHVLEDTSGIKYLKSFDTIMCSIDSKNNIKKYADVLSPTTRRHVNSFFDWYASDFNSKTFDKMQCDETPKLLIKCH